MVPKTKAPAPLDLFTTDGQGKYLTAEERERFLAAAEEHADGKVRSLCAVMAFTGCRISEALALTSASLDRESGGDVLNLRVLAKSQHRDQMRSLYPEQKWELDAA